MPPYATVAHVKARAGFLAEAWGEATDVSDADIGIFLGNIADELDAAITGLGQTPPTDGSTAALALVGMNADGALLLALDATFPAGEGPAAATALQESVSKRYEKAWERLLDKKHPATTAPEASGETPEESDFWSNNPEYGLPGIVSPADPAQPNPAIDPAVVRGQVW
jgi:hypothetical protein